MVQDALPPAWYKPDVHLSLWDAPRPLSVGGRARRPARAGSSARGGAGPRPRMENCCPTGADQSRGKTCTSFTIRAQLQKLLQSE